MEAILKFIIGAVSLNIIILLWIAWAIHRMKKHLQNNGYE